MAKTNSTKSNKVDPIRPFYAAVGTVAIAVAAARTGISEAQVRLAKVDFAPKAIPAQVEALVNDAVAELGVTVVRPQQAVRRPGRPWPHPGEPDPSPAGHPGPRGR